MLLNIFSDINECSNDNGHCEHICININGNYSCSCQDGYSLDINEKNCTGNYFEWDCIKYCRLFHVDINECDINNGGCEQICKNEVPFFNCSCNAGYKLSNVKFCAGNFHKCILYYELYPMRCNEISCLCRYWWMQWRSLWLFSVMY